jgi:hypothetical protein
MNQLGLSHSIQATAFGAFPWKTAGESHLQILLGKALFDTNHRAATGRERLGNLAIGCLWLALPLIAHQQHARHHIVFGRSAARMDHRLQKPSLLFTQFHGIAVSIGSHPWAPCFVGESCSVKKHLAFRFALAVNWERNWASRKFDESFSSWKPPPGSVPALP